MYFLFYILVVILILLFVLFQFFNVIMEKTEKTYQKYINLLIFTIVMTTVVGVIINVYSIIKNHNKVGTMGDPGISGKQGKKGNNGNCNSKCGQKVCYVNVVDKANKVFNKIANPPDPTNGKCLEVKYKINNKAFLKKINKLCNSDEYFAILTKKHEQQPTEQKLISYIENIVEDWIHLIIFRDLKHKGNIPHPGITDTNDGFYFLQSRNQKLDKLKEFKLDYFGETVYSEMYKYDIFRWGEPLLLKRKKIILKSDTLKHPSPDESELNIIKTNNYNQTYNANTKIDEWNDKDCPYNQMGVNKDNPNNLKECIYIDKNSFIKKYTKTWKETAYKKPNELSLYNVESYKNKNGQDYYPVGSVWRGQNSDVRPTDSTNYPESNTLCGDGHGLDNNQKHSNKGPEKETILVSGNVVSPESYEKIWDSKQKCPECQISHTQIFRPIAPSGYTCLGDVSIKWFDDKTERGKMLQEEELEKQNIKCVPSKCVNKFKLGNKVWDNKNFRYSKYNSYLNYTSKVPYKTNKQLAVSLWDGGNSNSAEEIKNNYGVELDENGGYNLFRASQDYKSKPKLDTYIIKPECLMPANGKIPTKLTFDKLNDTDVNTGNTRYQTTKYFGKKPQLAILTNIDDTLNNGENLLSNFDEPKKLYLVDDFTKRNDEADSFNLKTFNPEKNDFSSCLYYDDNYNNVTIKSRCDKNSNYNKWNVKIIKDQNEFNDGLSVNISIHPKDNHNYCLKSYYDKHGKSFFKLIENTNTYNWKYETPVSDKLPKPFIH